MRILGLLFAVVLSLGAYAQSISYGYNTDKLKSSITTIVLSENDSIYNAALQRIKESWTLTAEVKLINPDNPAEVKIEEGNCAIVPVMETLSTGEVNYRLTFYVAKKDFSPIGNQVDGYYLRVANGDEVASLVINPQMLHTVHCSNFVLALGTLVKAAAFMKTDADKDSKWKNNYYFHGMKDIVFEPSDLDETVRDKYKVQSLMFYGKVMDDELRNSPELFVKDSRGFAYITTEYRAGAEPLIHRFFVVHGRGLLYLQTDTQTVHPLHTYGKADLYIYGKAQREGNKK